MSLITFAYLIGGLVLLTLFIGVVTTAMDEAKVARSAGTYSPPRISQVIAEVRTGRRGVMNVVARPSLRTWPGSRQS